MQESPAIRFDDGAAYEDFMGKWSALAGDVFLDWLAAPPGWRWLDVGCGNGAFTQRLIERCAPAHVQGVDPSEGQIAYARERLTGRAAALAEFRIGDATALPYADRTFDAAVMALVIFFVPDPAKGVAEMARVVKPGGSVSAYAWDILGGGFPFAAVQEELDALGIPPLWPPSVQASRIDTMRSLWTGAGIERIETREITVHRTFADFDAFWKTAQSGPRVAPRMSSLPGSDVEKLKDRLRTRLAPGADGRITYGATANAIQGRLPG